MHARTTAERRPPGGRVPTLPGPAGAGRPRLRGQRRREEPAMTDRDTSQDTQLETSADDSATSGAGELGGAAPPAPEETAAPQAPPAASQANGSTADVVATPAAPIEAS